MPGVPYALSFGSGVTAKVTYTSPLLDNLDPVTVLQWVKIPGINLTGINTDRWFDKGPNIFFADGISSSGDIQLQRNRATANAVYNSNTGFIKLNVWQFWAFTYDSTATNVLRTLVGDLTTPASEITYASAANGSGANSSDSGTGLVIGNRSSDSRNLQGLCASVQVIAANLTVSEVLRLQFLPGFMASTRLLSYPGSCGKGPALDKSGNDIHGTIVNAVPTATEPILSPYNPAWNDQSAPGWQNRSALRPWTRQGTI